MNWDKNPIGEYAGIIWRALSNQEMSWEELLKTTKLAPLELASGIGWLAREGKIHIRSNNGALIFNVYRENYL